MEMAYDYQCGKTELAAFGTLACYDAEEPFPNYYGLFQLDGLIGLNGVCDECINRKEILSGVLTLIKNHPDFEFAAAFSSWDEGPLGKRDLWELDLYDLCGEEAFCNTLEYGLQPCNVEFGFSYDPARRLLKLLGPRSAWEAVKGYQALYTEEERRRFDPEESSRYYSNDPKGKQVLEEFFKWQEKRRAKKRAL